MSFLDCPCCGSDQLAPRFLQGNHDRGAVHDLICCGCGERIGPIITTATDPASTSFLDSARNAAKPVSAVDLSSSRRAS